MAGLLIAAVVSGYKARPAEQECRSLRYMIEDREDRLYLTEIELTQLLRAKDLYPVNRVEDHRAASDGSHGAVLHHPAR